MSRLEMIAELFGVGVLPDFAMRPRYNIAPTQRVAVVRAGADEGEGRRIDEMRWGLIPSWAKDPTIGARMINARSETAAEKPSFRSALKKRRCLVPADAFYEWKKAGVAGAASARRGKDAGAGGGGKQPYCIRMKEESPFAFAGLWEYWRDKNDEDSAGILSFTILTTTPNALMKPLHDRMPVIVLPKDHELWLDAAIEDPEKIRKLLKPTNAKLLKAYPVSRRVNNPRNDDAVCIEPVEPTEPKEEPDSTDPTPNLFS